MTVMPDSTYRSALTTTAVVDVPKATSPLVVSDFIDRGTARTPMRVHLPQKLDEPTVHALMSSLQDVARLRQQRAGWDGLHAEELTDEACGTAVRLLVELAMPAPPTAQLVPLVDGGIQLEWHVDENDVELEIDPVGDVNVFIAVRSGSVVMNRDVPPSLAPAVLLDVRRHLMRMARILHDSA